MAVKKAKAQKSQKKAVAKAPKTEAAKNQALEKAQDEVLSRKVQFERSELEKLLHNVIESTPSPAPAQYELVQRKLDELFGVVPDTLDENNKGVSANV